MYCIATKCLNSQLSQDIQYSEWVMLSHTDNSANPCINVTHCPLLPPLSTLNQPTTVLKIPLYISQVGTISAISQVGMISAISQVGMISVISQVGTISATSQVGMIFCIRYPFWIPNALKQ